VTRGDPGPGRGFAVAVVLAVVAGIALAMWLFGRLVGG
jgi:hypothetical protein